MDENKNIPENEMNNQPDDIINGEFEFDEVSFDADEITVVKGNEENPKAKIPFIVAICILSVTLIAGIVFYAVKGDKTTPPAGEELSSDDGGYNIDDYYAEMNTDEEYISWRDQILAEATTMLNNYVGSYSPNNIVEPSTDPSSSQEDLPTANTQQTSQAETLINSFFEKKFYIKGAMYDEKGPGDAFTISCDGNDVEAMGNLDGFEIAMMRLDGVVYFKRPALRQYVVLSDALMSFMGLEADFFEFEFSTTTDMQNHLVSVYDVTINKKPGVCYFYKTDDQQFKFFIQDGTIIQIEQFDGEGNPVTQMAIDYYSTSVPADHLTLKGYSETTFGTFFGDMLMEEF